MKKLIFILGVIAFGLYFTSCEKEEGFEPIEPTVVTDTIIMYDTTSTKIAITQMFNAGYDSLTIVNDTLCFYDTVEYFMCERWVLVSYDGGDYDTAQYDYYSYMPEPEMKTYFHGVVATDSSIRGISLTKDTTYILDMFTYNKELNTIEMEIPQLYFENQLETIDGNFIFKLDDNFLIESGTCAYDHTSAIYGNDETNYETYINGSITEQHGTYEVNVEYYTVEVSILPYTINHTVVITKI